MLSVIRKRSFLSLSPPLMAPATSSAPKARSSVNHQQQNISAKNCIVAWKAGRRTPPLEQRGSGSATFMRRPPSKLVLPWHEPLPLSKVRLQDGWQVRKMWCSGSGFAAVSDARRCSGFVRTVIGGSGIAVPAAVWTPGVNNAVLPTGFTNAVRKAGWTIGTGNGYTVNVTRRLA